MNNSFDLCSSTHPFNNHSSLTLYKTATYVRKSSTRRASPSLNNLFLPNTCSGKRNLFPIQAGNVTREGILKGPDAARETSHLPGHARQTGLSMCDECDSGQRPSALNTVGRGCTVPSCYRCPADCPWVHPLLSRLHL